MYSAAEIYEIIRCRSRKYCCKNHIVQIVYHNQQYICRSDRKGVYLKQGFWDACSSVRIIIINTDVFFLFHPITMDRLEELSHIFH